MFAAIITSPIASAASRKRAWGTLDQLDLAQHKARGAVFALAEESVR